MNRYKNVFKVDNFKKTFQEKVTELVTGPELSINDKIFISNELIDAFIEQTGYIPESSQINRLISWILREQLSDKSPDKVTNTDRPILSNQQYKTRNKREVPDQRIERLAKTGEEKTSRRDLTGFS